MSIKDNSHQGSKLSIILLEKLPLIILALFSSGITFYAQKSWGAVVSSEHLPISVRLGNAITSYIVYLGKTIWPFNLAVFYPYLETIFSLVLILYALILFLITVAVIFTAKKLPYLPVGWFWYIGTLIPVIGIVQVGSQSMADRYTYVPLIGVFIMFVWGLTDLVKKWRYRDLVLGLSSSLALLFFIGFTWFQVGFWKDNESLFKHATLVVENNHVAHNSLGLALMEKGDLDGAIINFKKVLEISPFYQKAYINIGQAFAEEGNIKEAIKFYEKGLALDEANADVHIGLGSILEEDGKTDEAEKHFKEALKTNPSSIEAYNNLGNLMLRRGNIDEAISNYKEALRIDPYQAEIYNNLGTAYIHKANIKKAIEFFESSLQENPDYAVAMENLKNARINQNRLNDVILKIQDMMKSDPNNPSLYTELGNVYRQLGEYDKAVSSYKNAISINPEFVQAMYGLVLVYSNNKEYSKAIDVLQDMGRFQPENAEIYYNIACIYSKQNIVDKAIDWLKQSIEMGFDNWDLIEKDPDLSNIRNTGYIIELMKEHDS